jgi:hypothetical protein
MKKGDVAQLLLSSFATPTFLLIIEDEPSIWRAPRDWWIKH